MLRNQNFLENMDQNNLYIEDNSPNQEAYKAQQSDFFLEENQQYKPLEEEHSYQNSKPQEQTYQQQNSYAVSNLTITNKLSSQNGQFYMQPSYALQDYTNNSCTNSHTLQNYANDDPTTYQSDQTTQMCIQTYYSEYQQQYQQTTVQQEEDEN